MVDWDGRDDAGSLLHFTGIMDAGQTSASMRAGLCSGSVRGADEIRFGRHVAAVHQNLLNAAACRTVTR